MTPASPLFCDFLRVAPVDGGDARYAGLTPAQHFSVALTLVGAVMWLRMGRQETAPKHAFDLSG